MNQFLGGLYMLYLTYKREFYIFTAINSMFLILSLMMGMLFSDIRIITIGIAMVVIFTAVVSMKVLDRTLPILLRSGLNRQRYIGVVASFMLVWALTNALVLFIINAIMLLITEQANITSIVVPRLTMLYDGELSLAVNFVMDMSLILLVAAAGLLMNVMFYRFGALGGYSFLGFILAVLFIAITLEWFNGLIDAVLSWNAAIFSGGMIGAALLILGLAWSLMNRISVVKVSV